jgi:hypothetical protein
MAEKISLNKYWKAIEARLVSSTTEELCTIIAVLLSGSAHVR